MTKQQAARIASDIQDALVAAYAPYKQQGIKRRFRVRLSAAVESAFWEHFPDDYVDGRARGQPVVLDTTIPFAPPGNPGWAIEQAGT